jgi:RHS repeat-associated protein
VSAAFSTKTTSTGTTSYTWDFENRLSSVTLPGTGGTVNFQYDPFGRRIYKSSPAGTYVYVYDGPNVIQELASSGNLLSSYTQGLGVDEPLALYQGAGTSYCHADGLGSIASLTSPAGAVAASYVYDSFGNLTASTGTVTNPFQYTARELDSETSIYYYRARYYDPGAGRFSSEDPIRIGGGINFYRYAGNDPVKLIDPYGLAQCFYSIWMGRLICYPDISTNPVVDIPVQSGNNGGGKRCKNNPDCHDKDRGPISEGNWVWTTEPTSKPNGRVLEPGPGNDTTRTLIRSHSCQNPFGPSLVAPYCSTGCITGYADDIKLLNQLLDAEPGSTLLVVD